MAKTISPDGTETPVELVDGKLTLEQMQTAVGGYVERVRIKDGMMFVDEDAKMKGKPVNEVATEMAFTSGSIAVNDFVVGTVLVVEGEEVISRWMR